MGSHRLLLRLEGEIDKMRKKNDIYLGDNKKILIRYFGKKDYPVRYPERN